MDLKPMVIN